MKVNFTGFTFLLVIFLKACKRTLVPGRDGQITSVNLEEYFQNRGQKGSFQVVREMFKNSEFIAITFNNGTDYRATVESGEIQYAISMRILYA